MILAGDIGGTKTTLGLYSEDSGPGKPLSEQVFASQEFGSLEEIISLFLHRNDARPVKAACFAVAGPVISGSASVTNLSWTVNSEAISDAFGLPPVKLINDVEAVACWVPTLAGSKDLLPLKGGQPVENGTIAVIAVGTGLGEAFLIWDGKKYVNHSSEGGHADFGPGNDLQSGLLTFMAARKDHVSWESVCSGMGMPNIYDYLESTGRYDAAMPRTAGPSGGPITTPAIVSAALEGQPPCPLCVETVYMFLSILGAEAGNLALKTMATGGVYIGGGIPPRMVRALENGPLIKAFLSKGRMTSLMERIPVHVILDPGAALSGASMQAFEISRCVAGH